MHGGVGGRGFKVPSYPEHDLKAQIARFENELAHLRQQLIHVEDLQAEIAELRERLGHNSRNSHRPPSSDSPSQKGKPTNEPRGRKRGAQPGHQGHTRQLMPLDEVDHTIELRPVSCTHMWPCAVWRHLHPMRHQTMPKKREDLG